MYLTGRGLPKAAKLLGVKIKKKLFEHFVLVKNVQLDKNMAGGRRDR